MTEKICQMIDTSASDRRYVIQFEEEVHMLTGMVEEMVRDNPSSLLSPVMRKLLVERAERVESIRCKLVGRLCADNPGPDFVT